MGPFAFLGLIASSVFLILAGRWLVELRRAAIAARLPLSPLDKAIAAAPIGYTLLCFVAAGIVGDRIGERLAMGAQTVELPIFGALSPGAALWILGLLAGLAVATPPIVVFTVEWHFASRFPDLVAMGRRAVWAILSGAPSRAPPAPAGGPDADEEARWKRLLA